MGRYTGAGVLGTLLTALVMTGCGGDSSLDTTGADAPPTLSLKALCPKVEAVLPKATMPKAQELLDTQVKLARLRTQSDLEAKNALRLLTDGVTAATAAYGAGGSGFEATQSYGDGISAFAHRCKLVGSSALQ